MAVKFKGKSMNIQASRVRNWANKPTRKNKRK